MTCQGDRWAVPALPPQQAPSHPEVPPHCPAALGRSGTAQAAWGAWLPTLAPPPAPGRQAQLLSLRAVNWMETRHGVRRQLECLLKNVISFYFPHSALPPFFQTITCSQLLLASCAAGGDLGAQTSVCVHSSYTASKDALLTLDICVGSLLTLWEQKVAVCGVARNRPFQGDPPPAAAQNKDLETSDGTLEACGEGQRPSATYSSGQWRLTPLDSRSSAGLGPASCKLLPMQPSCLLLAHFRSRKGSSGGCPWLVVDSRAGILLVSTWVPHECPGSQHSPAVSA